MKVVIDLSEKEIMRLVEAIGYPVENESDAECSLHLLIENCM